MSRRPSLVRAVASAGLCLVAVGCAATKTSNTGRTGMEQLLISNAVDQSLNKVDFRPLDGRNVHLDTTYLDCTDKSYVIAATRDRVLRAGGQIATKPEDADVVVEVRSGAVGTDQSESYVGIPEIALPGPLPVAIPQVKFWSRSTQTGTAKIGLVAYEAKTRTVLGRGGTTLARSDDSNTYVFGMGPYQSGSVRQEVSRQIGRPGKSLVPDAVAFGPLRGSAEPAKFRLAASDDETDPATFEGGPPAPAPAPPADPPTAPPGTASVTGDSGEPAAVAP